MALKGAIRIDHDGSKWKLYKTDKKPDDLTPEETELYEGLLGSRRMIELEQSRHATLRSAIKRFKRSLGSRLEREYFENNRRWFLAGLAISVVGFGALAWRWRFGLRPEALFLGVWLTGWTAGVSTLAYRLVQVVRTAKAGGGAAAWAGAGFLALFSVPFFAGEIIVGGILSTMVPRHLLVGVIGVGVYFGYASILKRNAGAN